VHILVLEDDPDARQLVHEAIAACVPPPFSIQDADHVAQCRRLLDTQRCDLLLADLSLPDGSGIEAIRHAARLAARPNVLVISSLADEDVVVEAITAGASGYVSKHDPASTIAHSIGITLAGGSCISPTIAQRLVGLLRRTASAACAPAAPAAQLTGSERKVLHLAAQGHNYRQIAQLTGTQPSTIYTHVRHVYEKLQVSNLAQALFEARRQRLV